LKEEEEVYNGVLEGGMPYLAMGDGPPLVYIRALPINEFIYKRFELNILPYLAHYFTVYAVDRKPGIKKGATMKDLASGYAHAIENEFGEAVNIMGISTGGCIAQQFAIDYPHLVRKLVLGVTAHKLGPFGRELQLKYTHLLSQGRYRDAARSYFPLELGDSAVSRYLLGLILWLVEPLYFHPDNPDDLVNTLLAEDIFNAENYLHKITAPTLLIGVEKDIFYSEELLRRTDDLIPNSKLIFYPKLKHSELEADSRFTQDVISFLND